MGLTPPLFVSPKPDPNPDPTLLQPSHWNRAVALLNGLFNGSDPQGSVLARDTSDATDGGRWIPSTVGILACDVAGSVPVFRALTAADLPSGGGVSAHHATHETGGADAITALDGSVITTGTVASLRIGSHHTHHDTGGSDAIAALSAAVLTSGTLANARLAADVVLTSSLSLGTNPAATGAIRLANNQWIAARNAGNTADVFMLMVRSDGTLDLNGSGTGTNLGGPLIMYGGTQYLAIGTNPATTGAIRLANNTGINYRNAANTADIAAISVDPSNTMRLGAAAVLLVSSGINWNFDSNGFYASTDNAYDLGYPTFRFRNVFVGSSLVSKVKAGTPTDADVSSPRDGMMVLDSTANKIWVRLGGVWKGVVVA